MSGLSLSVRFPGETFVSKAEFDAFCVDNQAVLDMRFAYEQGLAAGAREGCCAPCLCTTRFSSGPDDAPDWREGQVCGCDAALSHRARAVLHLLEAEAGLDAWSRILVVGPPSPIDRRLAVGRPELVRAARLAGPSDGDAPYRLDVAAGGFTLVLCWDYLHRVPPLMAALEEIRRALAPGAQFVFTLPFYYRAGQTVSRLGHVPRRGGWLPAEFRGEIHEIGWDILDMLRTAGFARARAHHYWSDELGYLGAFNLLFSACA